LNAQLANMKVKKILQIADNIRNDETVVITATKAIYDTDVTVATADLKSQDIALTLAAEGVTKYLSSVTSLAIRLPAFDHVDLNSKAYMRIKSDEFVFAKSLNGGTSNVIIIPTDDSRLKAVIVPLACLTQQSQS